VTERSATRACRRPNPGTSGPNGLSTGGLTKVRFDRFRFYAPCLTLTLAEGTIQKNMEQEGCKNRGGVNWAATPCSGCGVEADVTQRCSKCLCTAYCSRGCQLQHWKLGHRWRCTDLVHWVAGCHLTEGCRMAVQKDGLTDQLESGFLSAHNILTRNEVRPAKASHFHRVRKSPVEFGLGVDSLVYPYLQ
jgi:hypothetical protein